MHIGFTALETVIAILMLLVLIVWGVLGLLEHRTHRRPSWERHVDGALDVLGTRRAHDDLNRRWP